MKYIKLFESTDTSLIEIEDTFAPIYDLIGKPIDIKKTLYDRVKKCYMYDFFWELEYNISNLNDISILENLNDLITELKDATYSIKERLSIPYDLKISISNNKIHLNIIPNESSDTNYQFIISKEWRSLLLNRVDIIRYFKNKGTEIQKIEDKYDEAYNTSSLTIYLKDISYADEFTDLLENELESKEIDFEIDYNIDDNSIELSTGEKRHIVI